MKRLSSLLLALLMLLPLLPRAARAAAYPDVPAGSWAQTYIDSARESGLLLGDADGAFGYGRQISRAEFVTVLCRMFGWQPLQPEEPSFSDLGGWYDGYVEAALAHGAFDSADVFRPRDAITRREMAVMLVRALGFGPLAAQVQTASLPFTDVSADRGYITIAHDIGMVDGMTPDTFVPEGTAKREEAAAMLVRVNTRWTAKTDWLHGFYALSSYSQKELAGAMDAVSYGWSHMTWDGTNAALNTSDGDWKIPSSYKSIAGYLSDKNVPANLTVAMLSGCKALLASASGRTQAATQIAAEATRVYDAIGRSPYAGVTIDFEALRSDSKQNFVLFLRELRGLLPANLTLYCCVQPLMISGSGYGGYDFRAIGDLCDKVILMAHDYGPSNMNSLIGTAWQYKAAPTPLAQVWCALLQLTDPETGVADVKKVALALSMGNEGWYVDAGDKLADGTKLTPAPSSVRVRMLQSDTVFGFQESSGCAWMRYTLPGDRIVFLWYENEQSVALRLLAARMLGVTGVSMWRLGTIPDYTGWNVWDAVTATR
jgi:hypothetical protein